MYTQMNTYFYIICYFHENAITIKNYLLSLLLKWFCLFAVYYPYKNKVYRIHKNRYTYYRMKNNNVMKQGNMTGQDMETRIVFSRELMLSHIMKYTDIFI